MDHPASLHEWLEIDLWPKGWTQSNEVLPPWKTSRMIHACLCAHTAGDQGAQFFSCENLSPSVLGPQRPTFFSFGGRRISVLSGNILHPHVTDPVVKESEEQNGVGVTLGKEIFLKGW